MYFEEVLRMTKRNCIAVIVVLLITCFQLVTLAVNDDLTLLLDKIQLNVAEERNEVQKAIDEFNVKEFLLKHKQQYDIKELFKVTNADELIYGTPYKVVIATRAIIDALLDGKNLTQFVTEAPYYWEFPVLLKNDPKQAVTSFQVHKTDGKWQVGEIGAFLRKEDLIFSSESNSIKTILKKNNVENVSSLYHLRIFSLRQDYLYLNSADQEYFIPVNHFRPGIKSGINKFTLKPGAENTDLEKNIQTRDAVMSQIGDQLKENIKNGSPYNMGGDGISGPHKNPPFIPYLIFGGAATVLLSWIILHKLTVT